MTAESGGARPIEARSRKKRERRSQTAATARVESYAAARRFCFTSVEVERLPFARAPLLRFGLSD